MYRVKINKITRSHPKLKNAEKDKAYLKECRKFLKKNFKGYRNTRWHHFYSTLNGIKKVDYIPEELFFAAIEPTLNNKKVSSAYTDKNAYSLFIDKKYLPKTIFKLIKGRYYTEESDWVENKEALKTIAEINEQLILKPAIKSGGGKDIVIEKGPKIAELLKKDPVFKSQSYVLQYFAKQHPDVAIFHPPSLNTFRIMTARVNNEFILPLVCLRMGCNNKLMDNTMAGGLYVNITNDGRMHKYAFDNDTLPYKKHPDTGIVFENYKVPGYHEAIEFCKINHKKLLNFNIISWDIGVQEDEIPLFIEFNLGSQAINALQVLNGPIFGKHTDYFINLYKEIKMNRISPAFKT
jgi:hypothetical protein